MSLADQSDGTELTCFNLQGLRIRHRQGGRTAAGGEGRSTRFDGQGRGRRTTAMRRDQGGISKCRLGVRNPGCDRCVPSMSPRYRADQAYRPLPDEEAVGRLVRSFKKSFKRLDGLVNCAGALRVHSLRLEETNRIFTQASTCRRPKCTRSRFTCGARRWMLTHEGPSPSASISQRR